MIIRKIISGGQTGADIAGVDAAISCDYPYGGWLPKGRKSLHKNGIVPEKYTHFKVLARGGYPKRTEQNVIDSDGTVIFTYGKLTRGSSLTKKVALKNKRPWLHIDLNIEHSPALKIKDFIIDWDINVLNIAGERAKSAPAIYKKVKKILINVLN